MRQRFKFFLIRVESARAFQNPHGIIRHAHETDKDIIAEKYFPAVFHADRAQRQRRLDIAGDDISRPFRVRRHARRDQQRRDFIGGDSRHRHIAVRLQNDARLIHFRRVFRRLQKRLASFAFGGEMNRQRIGHIAQLHVTPSFRPQ